MRRGLKFVIALAVAGATLNFGWAHADDTVSITGNGGRIGGAVERTSATPGSSAGALGKSFV